MYLVAFDKSQHIPNSSRKFGLFFPVLHEYNSLAGSATGHYYHQDLLVANYIYKANPDVHFDVGSKIDGFISHLLSFEQRVVVGDIRPVNIPSDLVSFFQFDLMSSGFLPASDTFSSISCLHALEHMGLGRYGDPIDPLGHHKAVKNLALMLSPNGTLYLSHPCGRIGRTEFNAHRVITLLEMKHLFDSLLLQVVSFSYVDDNGCLVQDISVENLDYDTSYQLNYGCAIWSLKRA